MLMHPLDAILGSRTSDAILLPWFGTAYGGYSWRTVMLLWIWYYNSFATDYKRYEINSVNKVYK